MKKANRSFPPITLPSSPFFLPPSDYFKNLFHNNHQARLYPSILKCYKDPSTLKQCVESIAFSIGAVRFLKFEQLDSNLHYLVDQVDEIEGMISIIDHQLTPRILESWQMSYHLPSILPNGSPIVCDSIKTIDQLLELMSQFNPFWLLELIVIAYDQDYSKLISQHDYRINLDQYDQIVKFLDDHPDQPKEKKNYFERS